MIDTKLGGIAMASKDQFRLREADTATKQITILERLVDGKWKWAGEAEQPLAAKRTTLEKMVKGFWKMDYVGNLSKKELQKMAGWKRRPKNKAEFIRLFQDAMNQKGLLNEAKKQGWQQGWLAKADDGFTFHTTKPQGEAEPTGFRYVPNDGEPTGVEILIQGKVVSMPMSEAES